MSLLLAELARQIRAGAPEEPTPSYDQVVTGLSGGAPLAYWRFSNAGAIIDEMPGERDGTWDGAVTLVGGLPQDSDQATSMPGTVTGQIPHDGGLALAAQSVSLWFMLPSTTGLHVLISKDGVGLNNGDWNIQVMDGGVLRAAFQSDAGGFQLDVPGILSNTPYHVGVTAGGSGVELWLNGQHRITNTDYTNASLGNTQPIDIGSAQWTGLIATAIIDEVALYARVLSDADIIELTQKTGAPVAGSDSTTVTETESVTVNVAAISQYLGRKSSLTITPIQGDHGTATVNGENNLVYTADAATGGQTDQVGYTITDANGTSAPGTISIQIEAGAGAADDYGSDTLALSGMVAYWRLGDTSTALLADSSGNGRHGSYAGAPTLGVADLVWGGSDGRAVNFAGAGTGNVPHVASFALARGTLAFYFKPNSLAATITLVAKHGAGANQMRVRVTTAGRLRLEFGARTLETVAGVIAAGREYHCAVIWDQIAIHLLLDGREVYWDRNHTAGLTNNTLAWEFGSGNVVMDEIVLFNRRLPWAETDQLSEYIRGLPYNPTPESTVTVSNVAALQTAVAAAPPGRHILLNAGTYNLNGVTFTFAGAKRRPVVLRPNGGAVVTLTGEFVPDGQWAVFDGFRYNNAWTREVDNSRYIRVTRGTFTNLDRSATHLFRGRWGRFDHNDLSDTQQTTAVRHGVRYIVSAYNLTDRNYFHDAPFFGNEFNGFEAIAPGTNLNQSNNLVWATIENNLFQGWLSDQEIISVKTSGNLLRGNTVIGSLAGNPTAFGGIRYGSRHGSLGWYEGEWVEAQSVGLLGRAYQTTFLGIHLQNANAGIMKGTGPGNDHFLLGTQETRPASYQALVIGVTRNNGNIIIGVDHGGNFAANFTTIFNSQGVSLLAGNHTNTTNNSGQAGPVPHPTPVRLTPGNVGTAAADPLVPAGWK